MFHTKKTINSTFPKPIYLGAAVRSPIGRFGGSLLPFNAPQLAAKTLKQSLLLSPEIPSTDWVLLGHARQAGNGPNTARQAALYAGLPKKTPAITFNQACFVFGLVDRP